MGKSKNSDLPQRALDAVEKYGGWEGVLKALSANEQREADYLALRAECEWRPIESAPKDGTPILAWSPRYGMVITFWAHGYTGQAGSRWGWSSGESDEIDRVFHDYDNDRPATVPTHWRPMLAGPAAIDAGRES